MENNDILKLTEKQSKAVERFVKAAEALKKANVMVLNYKRTECYDIDDIDVVDNLIFVNADGISGVREVDIKEAVPDEKHAIPGAFNSHTIQNLVDYDIRNRNGQRTWFKCNVKPVEED